MLYLKIKRKKETSMVSYFFEKYILFNFEIENNNIFIEILLNLTVKEWYKVTFNKKKKLK